MRSIEWLRYRDRGTDIQTHDESIYHGSTLSCSKNRW